MTGDPTLWSRRLIAQGWPLTVAADLAHVIATGDKARLPNFAAVEVPVLAMASEMSMTAAEFVAWRERLGISRAEAARRLGLHPNSMTNYQEGRTPIPLKVVLACAMIAKGGAS